MLDILIHYSCIYPFIFVALACFETPSCHVALANLELTRQAGQDDSTLTVLLIQPPQC